MGSTLGPVVGAEPVLSLTEGQRRRKAIVSNEQEGAAPQENWSGTYRYEAARIARPTSLDEVAALIRSTPRVHALGTRHSFNALPDTDGTLIDLTGLPTEITVDAAASTARVTAWTRYGVVAQALEEAGFALHNMGSLPHIAVGGATATSTHGSGDRNGSLSTAVRALTVLDADGVERTVRRGDPDFAALVVHVGAFAIVTHVELDIQPTYRVRQDIYSDVTWDAALADLDAITTAGHSVSIFTRWEGEDLGFVWVKTRLAADTAAVADVLLDGTLTPDGSPLGSDDNVTELRGVPGPWLLRLPHFRHDREPSFGAEIQTEYFIDRADAPAALQAVRGLAALIRPHLVWSELRTIAADELWLSPAYQRDSMAIHFTWFDRPDEVGALIPLIEDALRPFGARPHWGKVHGFDAARLAEVHPRLADARAVFERLDPHGRFVNAYLERAGIR